MKKCGWCSRKHSDDVTKCVCGWEFPSQANLAFMRISRALSMLQGEKTAANDISFWQRRPDGPPNDFDKMATKSRGVWIKKSQATRIDRDGAANYAWARGKIARGGYHYSDWTKTALDQADFFWGTFYVNGILDLGELAPWLDWEEWEGAPEPGTARLFFRTQAERMIYHLRGVGWDFGRQKLGAYTSNGYWRYFGSPDQWWAENLDLMIAHYGVVNPTIPRPWTTHRVHQWGFGDGVAHGVQSLEIDMDNFNGGESAWNAYALPLPGSVPPPEPPPPGDVYMRSKCVQPWQYFRSDHYATAATLIPGPGMNGYRVVIRDEIVETNEPPWMGSHSGGDTWIRVRNSNGEYGWIATNYGGTTYQQTVV